MAKVRGGLDRVLLKYPGMDLSRVRLIAWGAGQYFTDFYPMTGLRVEYTICPYAHNQGRVIHGIEVRPPEALLQEPRDGVLVVIFAGHVAEIMQQIRNDWGDYPTVAAVGMEDLSAHLRAVEAACATVRSGARFIRPERPGRRRLGIFVQGPVFDITPATLAHTRLQYPDAHLCYVTWKTEDADRIASCRPWVDAVELVDPPEYGGADKTRNYVIRACRTGSRHMRDRGVEYVVRARSDAWLTGDIHRTVDRMFEDGGKHIGRIGFFMGASWAYLPFQFSDKLILARTEDMVALWAVDEDPRPENQESAEARERFFRTAHYLSMKGSTIETYVWMRYARSLGYATDGLEDSYRFARDRLLPLEPDMGMLSLKHTPLFDLRFRPMVTPSQAWWEEIHTDFEGAASHLRQIESTHWTLAHFFQNKVG